MNVLIGYGVGRGGRVGSREGAGKEGRGRRKGSQMLSDFWLDKHVVVLSTLGESTGASVARLDEQRRTDLGKRGIWRA